MDFWQHIETCNTCIFKFIIRNPVHRSVASGAIGDCLQKHFFLHIPIAIIKLSGLNVFICISIFRGRRRTKKCLSNQNVQSEHYDSLSYLPVKICMPVRRRGFGRRFAGRTLSVLSG